MADESRKAILAQIEAKYPAALAGDYLGLLEVAEADSTDALKSAFFKMARVFHPDVLSRCDLEPRELEKGRFVFKKLSEAYNTLTDNGRRATYLAKARTVQSVKEEPQRSPEEEAEIFYHKALILLRRGNTRDAVDFLKRALALRKDEPRYLLDLGWTVFNDGTLPVRERIEDARAYFEKVLDQTSNNIQAGYYMALYHKAKNDVESAYQQLKDCLTLDPTFTPAKREIHLLRLRLKKEAEKRRNPFYKLKALFGGGERE